MAHRPQTSASDADVRRCHRELSAIEALIRSGHPDLEVLCLALSDWWAELRLIKQGMALKAKTPASADAERAEGTEPDVTS
jgi:hypothetical protein